MRSYRASLAPACAVTARFGTRTGNYPVSFALAYVIRRLPGVFVNRMRGYRSLWHPKTQLLLVFSARVNG